MRRPNRLLVGVLNGRRWRHLLATSVLPALVLAACDFVPAVNTLEAAGLAMGLMPSTRVNDLENLVFDYDQQLTMRGNPEFEVENLSEDQRLWYERLWDAASSSDQEMDAIRLAKSDDAYEYGRALYTHNHSLLLGLRATGDLRFLDEVDGLMQIVRDELYDGWCDGVRNRLEKGWYDTMRGRDGYLNFRRRRDESADTYCRDVADLEEAMVHGHLAMIMYAYHVNRDLASPSGIDYGERADFWFDYLVNHFEAKWRERSDQSFPRMDFIDLKFCHTFNTFNLYYYYVGMRMQDDGDRRASAYLQQARLLTDMMFEIPYVRRNRAGGFMPTGTPLGDAVVYSFGAPGQEVDVASSSLEACPTTYARYMIPSLVQLRLEGFYRWDDVIMRKIATGLAYFVLDTDGVSSRSEPFAAGVTGRHTVEGIPRTEYRSRVDASTYALSSLANIAPWDDSGRILQISLAIHEAVEEDPSDPTRVHLPASFLLNAALRN
jgi:hypothetical protein